LSSARRTILSKTALSEYMTIDIQVRSGQGQPYAGQENSERTQRDQETRALEELG